MGTRAALAALKEFAAPTAIGDDNCRRVASGLVLSGISTATACVVVAHSRGRNGALAFFASYLMELSLSVDNMFAFYLIFKFYHCPPQLQSGVLGWGIVGAIVLRAVALLTGVAVVRSVRPLMLVLALALLYSGAKMAFTSEDDDDEDLSNNAVVALVRRLVPMTETYHGTNLLVRNAGGQIRATPLLVVLITVEVSDIMFAIDSVPAVLGMSEDTLVIYLAVMCAVLSLRSIYTVTVLLVKELVYLQPAVALLLAFVGFKIALDILFKVSVSNALSLAVIISVLFVGTVASLVKMSCRRAYATVSSPHAVPEAAAHDGDWDPNEREGDQDGARRASVDEQSADMEMAEARPAGGGGLRRLE